MTTIELTADEATILRNILEHDHDGVLLELSRADSLAYKNVLRPREALLTKVLQQLGANRSVN